MSLEQCQKLVSLANQLRSALAAAATCADEIGVLVTEIASTGSINSETNHNGGCPIVDRSTLSLSWNGKTCRLGHTVLFRLAEQFSRRPNLYLGEDQLRREVWNGDLRSSDTIRSAVRHLRRRLDQAGMCELAASIHGHRGGYAMMLMPKG